MKGQGAWRAICLGYLMTLSLQASAQDKEKQRSKLYEEGTRLAARGKWPEAAVKYRQVIDLRSDSLALVALADAELHLDHPVQGHVLCLLASRETKSADDKAAAQECLSQSRKAIVTLKLQVIGPTQPTQILIDGDPATLQDDSIFLAPGIHRLDASAPSQKPFRRVLTSSAGQIVPVEIRLTPVRDEPAAPSSATPAGPSGGPPTGALVLGGAGIVVAVISGINFKKALDDFDACTAQRCPTDETNGARDRAGNWRIGLIAGGGLFAGGALWWLLSPSPDKSTVVLAPGYVGGTFRGSF